MCGRDIKNAIIDAAVRAAVAGRTCVTLDDLIAATERIKTARISTSDTRPLSEKEAEEAKAKILAKLKNGPDKTSNEGTPVGCGK